VHRTGRAARAGAAGDAISFGCETYAMVLPEIEEYIGHKIPVANYDPTLLPELKKPAPRQRKERRGGPSRRDSGSDRRPRRRPRSKQSG